MRINLVDDRATHIGHLELEVDPHGMDFRPTGMLLPLFCISSNSSLGPELALSVFSHKRGASQHWKSPSDTLAVLCKSSSQHRVEMALSTDREFVTTCCAACTA